MLNNKKGLIVLAFLLGFSKAVLFAQNDKKNPIVDIQVQIEQVTGFCPGSEFQIGVIATYKNGKQKSTKGMLDGPLKWDHFKVEVDNGIFNHGTIHLTEDPRRFAKGYTVFRVTSADDPALTRTLTVVLNYKCAYTVYANGQNGKNGSHGSNGYSMNGGNGTNGNFGTNGDNGMHADNANVYVKGLQTDSGVYLKVAIISSNPSKDARFLINTLGGTLVINAKGGNGGNGGDGGKGGDGMDGTQYTQPGYGGNGGNGGDGGNGGNGGSIIIYYDAIAEPYLNKIVAYVDGGSAGAAGMGGRKGKGGQPYVDPASKGKLLKTILNNTAGNAGANGQPGYTGNNGVYKTEKSESVYIDW